MMHPDHSGPEENFRDIALISVGCFAASAVLPRQGVAAEMLAFGSATLAAAALVICAINHV